LFERINTDWEQHTGFAVRIMGK